MRKSSRRPPCITVCNGWAIRPGIPYRAGRDVRQRGHAGKITNCVSQVRFEQLACPTPCADGGAKAWATFFPQAYHEHKGKFALPWVSENTRWKTPREHQEINKVMKTRVALEICTSTWSTSCSSWHVHYTRPSCKFILYLVWTA